MFFFRFNDHFFCLFLWAKKEFMIPKKGEGNIGKTTLTKAKKTGIIILISKSWKQKYNHFSW